MDAPAILTISITGIGVLAFFTILFGQRKTGNAVLAAGLCAAFAAFTLVQTGQEGVAMFWTNHSANLTGVQVWWDLVTATLVALFLILPRARAAGMHTVPWSLLVISTASIGLLAMCARLFWLERAVAATDTDIR